MKNLNFIYCIQKGNEFRCCDWKMNSNEFLILLREYTQSINFWIDELKNLQKNDWDIFLLITTKNSQRIEKMEKFIKNWKLSEFR